MRTFILGTEKDIILDKINRFLYNLYNVKSALIHNGFPSLIAYVAYLPIFLVVSILNLIRIEILQVIVVFVCLTISLVFIGVVFSLLMIALKGAKIYAENHGENAEATGAD